MTQTNDIRALLDAGRFDAALKALDGVDAPLLKAEALIGKRRNRAALDILETLPETPESLFLTGRARFQLMDGYGAVAAFERVDSAHPGRDEALAAAYRRDARYHDAVRVAEAAETPSRQLRYDRAASLAALGEAEVALAAFDGLNRDFPDFAAAWFGGHGPALDLLGVAAARARLERAAACPGASGKYLAFLAAYGLLAGGQVPDVPAKHRALVDGVEAIRPHLAPDCRLFGLSAALLRHAVALAGLDGLVLEFGVRRGTSLRVIAGACGRCAHGFDSFEGLPEGWGNEPQGVLTTGRQLPAMPDNVTLHPGWFEDTLPGFLAAHAGVVRFANIDSDIYASAKTVLTALTGRIEPGTVLVFDEYIGNAGWARDEYRAFNEFMAETGLGHEILAVGPATKQVAVRITPPRAGAAPRPR